MLNLMRRTINFQLYRFLYCTSNIYLHTIETNKIIPSHQIWLFYSGQPEKWLLVHDSFSSSSKLLLPRSLHNVGNLRDTKTKWKYSRTDLSAKTKLAWSQNNGFCHQTFSNFLIIYSLHQSPSLLKIYYAQRGHAIIWANSLCLYFLWIFKDASNYTLYIWNVFVSFEINSKWCCRITTLTYDLSLHRITFLLTFFSWKSKLWICHELFPFLI